MKALFDPHSLRLFVLVCDERNIARAASRAALAASAVSKRIAALEQQLGTSLLERGRRGARPTAAGEALLLRARELLAGMERMQLELAEFAEGVQGSVRVLASVSALAESLPDDIASFLAQQPSLQISLAERASADIVKQVSEGAADLGVVWEAVGTGQLQALPYRRDHLYVVMAPDHPLATRKRLRLHDTLPYASIGVSPGGLADQLLRRETAKLGHNLSHRIEVSNLEAGCRVVAARLGIAIMPIEAVTAQLAALKLQAVPMAEPWSNRQFVVVARADPWVSAGARLLIDHLHGVVGR